MLLLNFFVSRRKNTACIAKERLKYIFLKNQNNHKYSKCFNNMKKDVLCMIHKYLSVKDNMVNIDIHYKNLNLLVLHVDIVISHN